MAQCYSRTTNSFIKTYLIEIQLQENTCQNSFMFLNADTTNQ